MNALAIIQELLGKEEDPKAFLKMVAPTLRPNLQIGDEAIRGTSDVRDITEACLDLLKHLDRNAYLHEISDSDVFNFTSLGEYNDQEFDPDYYLFEHLFSVLQKYCPPFTYFGFYEADGSVGCWPLDSTAMADMEEEGKLTIVKDAEDPERAVQIMNGDLSSVPTDYVLLVHSGCLELWSKSKQARVWRW